MLVLQVCKADAKANINEKELNKKINITVVLKTKSLKTLKFNKVGFFLFFLKDLLLLRTRELPRPT